MSDISNKEVIEIDSDDDANQITIPSEAESPQEYDEDIIHVDTRRRRSSSVEIRQVRPRIDNSNNDIEIVQETRVFASPSTQTPGGFQIVNSVEDFRRNLLRRMHAYDLGIDVRDLNRYLEERRFHRPVERRHYTDRFLQNLEEIGDGSGSGSDPDYESEYYPMITRNSPFANDLRILEEMYTNEQAATSAHILERIEQDNEQIIDRKLRDENIYNRNVTNQKRDAIKREQLGYTSAIDGDNIGCELCGVTLGEGIPQDFKPQLHYAENFQQYREDYKCHAPWFCCKQLTDVDKDLSKRVFLNKCGHLYCGRCIKNIGNRPRAKKGQKLQISIDNPHIFAPGKCVATECGHRLVGKKNFTELYF